MKECNQCGKCCSKYGGSGLSVSPSELEYWETFRPDLYRYVYDGKIWINPETKEQLQQCPWLRKIPNQEKYSCDIYFDRPDDCRYYPSTIAEMVMDECEMLESHDLVNTKQAQIRLDRIMADSRPAVE